MGRYAQLKLTLAKEKELARIPSQLSGFYSLRHVSLVPTAVVMVTMVAVVDSMPAGPVE